MNLDDFEQVRHLNKLIYRFIIFVYKFSVILSNIIMVLFKTKKYIQKAFPLQW